MNRVAVVIILFFSTVLYAQDLDRISINGKIVAESNDIESVTVFNTSSNKGTITNVEGEFTIEVTLNDVIEVSALQFKTVKVTINQSVLENKLLKIFLIEEINTLDAVVLLPYNLTGNLVTDVEDVKLIEPIEFSFGYFGNYDLTDDYKSGVDNIVMNEGQYYNMVDFSQVFKMIFKPKRGKNDSLLKNEDSSKELTDVYSHELLSTIFNISQERVEAFIVFVEENGLTKDLLQEKNGMQLVAFLWKQRELFLRS